MGKTIKQPRNLLDVFVAETSAYDARQNFRYMLLRKGWRIAQLSKITGISVQTLYDYRSGRVDLRYASGTNLYLISKALGCPISVLLGASSLTKFLDEQVKREKLGKQ